MLKLSSSSSLLQSRHLLRSTRTLVVGRYNYCLTTSNNAVVGLCRHDRMRTAGAFQQQPNTLLSIRTAATTTTTTTTMTTTVFPMRRNCCFSFSSRRTLFTGGTVPLLEKMTMKVPAMGDSITEGTIVEWTASVGQAVKEGDVVALIETDKVTVDIKAEVDGVVTEHYGAVDDTVEVGGDLYQIDTEGEATVTAAEASEEADAPETTTEEDTTASAAVESAEATATEAPPDSTSSSQHEGRTPSIHFLGREGWARRRTGEKHEEESLDLSTPESKATTAAPSTTDSGKPHAVTTVDGSDIGPMYGRLKFTEEEMEALVMGGASLTPEKLRT